MSNGSLLLIYLPKFYDFKIKWPFENLPKFKIS